METCEYHTLSVADIAVMKNDLAYIKDKVCSHVSDGDKPGGFRDRLIILEQEVSALKKAMWIRVAVAGFVGGLVANGTPEAVQWLIKIIIR